MTEFQTATINSISELVTKGTTPTSMGKSFTTRGVRFIKVETITPDGQFVPAKVAFIDADTHDLLRRSQLRENDLLFSIAGALGRSTIVQASWLPANTNQAFAVIRPSSRSRIYPRYLLWALRSDAIRTRIAEINVRAAQANLSLAQVRDFEIPLPENESQRQIARILDDADALTRALECLIAKKDAVKQGMMQQLLAGRIRLRRFSSRWREAALDDLGRIVSGGTPRSSSAFWNGGIAWCTPADITREPGRYLQGTERMISKVGLEKSAACLLPRGSLLLCTRATIGELKIALSPVATNQGFKSLVPDPGVSSEFLYYKLLMLKDVLVSLGTGSTFREVSKSDIARLRIAFPPLEEQAAIASVLMDADDEIEKLRAALKKAKAIKQGMMQELLTGRTRLPMAEAAAA